MGTKTIISKLKTDAKTSNLPFAGIKTITINKNSNYSINNPLPKHVGIIMDGNRRYAKKQNMFSWQGHEYGARKMLDTMKWAKEIGVKELTFYAFSTENFKRPKEEFDKMMELFVKLAKELLDKFKEKTLKANEKIRIRYVGLIHLFPLHVQDLMRKIMDATKAFTDYVVNIAVGYGSRLELINAFKNLYQKIKSGELSIEKIDEAAITKELFIQSEPEIIIRTGGTKRLSNFLLWQASYSEIYFMDKLWPEFTKEDLQDCIDNYTRNVKINLGA